MTKTKRTGCKWQDQRGQTSIMVVLMLGLFLLAFVGFSADFSNLWFHRQSAQSAADAACQAGAMNMLVEATGTATATQGFVTGTAFDCDTTPAAIPCKYAALNGYNSGGLTAGESNWVRVTFPTSVPNASAPPAGLAPTAFIRVDVIDRVKVIFASLLGGSKTQDVRATAKCGLVLATSPIPILVLHPTMNGSLAINGTPTVKIYGGPSRSIEVNSQSTTSVSFSGSGSLIDLSTGGNANTGSDLGVQGGEPSPCGSPTASCGNFNPGSTGHWTPASAISDPFAQIAAPSNTGMTSRTGPYQTVAHLINGCPDPAGCDEYGPGQYPSGIQVQNRTAIFDPGVYYLNAPSSGSCRNIGFCLGSNSTARPSSGVIGTGTNAIGGTMFYFSGSAGVSVAANSGSIRACSVTITTNCVDSFNTSNVQCSGGAAVTVKDTSGNVLTTVDGNVLLGACTGTYGDPLGQYRAMLFFQDRSAASVGANWSGGGSLLLAGNMYYHQCNSSDGAGKGTNCNSSTGFNNVMTLGGGSGSGTFILGEIVADQLHLGGTSGIAMSLNPNAAYSVLKVQLLQ